MISLPPIILIGIGLIVLQMFVPEIHFLHARPFLLPLLITYSALRFDLVKALIIAVTLGLFWDLFSSERLGLSCLTFMAVTLFIACQEENFKFEYIPHALLLTLSGLFLYGILDYFFYCFQMNTWRWPFRIWQNIAGETLFATFWALPIYWLLDSLNAWVVHKSGQRRVEKSRG